MSQEDQDLAERIKQIQAETAEQLGIKKEETVDTTDPRGTTLPSTGVGAGRGNIFPPSEGAPMPMVKQKPNVIDIAGKVVDKIKNMPMGEVGDTFLDPSIDTAIAGSYLGAKSTGAGLNPFKLSTFLQADPAELAKNAAKGNQAWLNSALTQFPEGPQRLTVQELGELTKMPVNTSKDIWQALVRLNGTPAVRTPNIKEINGKKVTVGYRTTPAQMPIDPDVARSSSFAGRLGNTLEDVAPGATKFVKGALPVVNAATKGLVAGLDIGDVASRLYNQDYPGAGISTTGAIAGMLLAPEIGIPAGLASYAINKARDEPKQVNLPVVRKDALAHRQKLAQTLPSN
jgi:hypothetical protein